jgi:signal transduction histidine kinase
MWWLAVLAAYSVLTLLFTGQVRLDYMVAGRQVSWAQAFAISSVAWYSWALLTPIVIWLGRRWPITLKRWWRAIVIHGPLCLLLMTVKGFAAVFVVRHAIGMAPQPAPLLTLYVGFFTYFTILGADAAMRQARARREQELRTSELQGELARAELDALRMRLHPHFLFNTLNSIAALMREDVEAADLMLTRLSDLLRMTLDRSEAQEAPLRDELDFVDKYIEIQRVRFGDRLTTRVEASPDTLALAVPSLMLQPIVENAFRHGAGAKPGPVTIAIRCQRRSDHVDIEVEDDGPGPPPVLRSGYGLETTRARLRHLYGSAAGLTLERAASGGAIARLTVPARPMPTASPAPA